ncbi:hypothetical protein [Falsiroseomonas sp.]|uniref:hypothetical protein n=1 Tax=Falsiroseomonas sp. TaxID=2870721 RepID=UPI0035679102
MTHPGTPYRSAGSLDAAIVPAVGPDGVARPRTVAALRGGGFVSVRDLGAIGDGRSHPLSERYRSLASARADFPHARSLSDEIDWAATQGAIARVRAAGGGTVVSPAGVYVCSRTLEFPERKEFGAPPLGEQVNWLGEGMYATVYRWPTDLGADAFAVTCPRRHAAESFYEGFWQDIGLEGSGRTARMHGWGWGARRRMVRCSARGFRVGLDIVGDHARFEDVTCGDCHYGVYFSRPSRELYGDLVFDKCMFSACGMAAIAVHPEAEMGGATMLGCYIGGAPYAIMKEAGPGRDSFLSGSVFLNCMFEFIGNAWLHDDNTPRIGIVRHVLFDTCLFLWRDAERLTRDGRRRIAAWDFRRADHVRLVNQKEPHFLIPGEEALFRVEQPLACEFSLNLHALIENCTRTGRPLLHRAAERYGSFRYLRVSQAGEWEGRLQLVAPGPGVRRADVLEWAPQGLVRRGAADSPAPVAGICMMDAAPGAFTVVATEASCVPVRCPDPRAEGLLVKGEDGAAAPSRGGRDEVRVGWCLYAAEGKALTAFPVRS